MRRAPPGRRSSPVAGAEEPPFRWPPPRPGTASSRGCRHRPWTPPGGSSPMGTAPGARASSRRHRRRDSRRCGSGSGWRCRRIATRTRRRRSSDDCDHTTGHDHRGRATRPCSDAPLTGTRLRCDGFPEPSMRSRAPDPRVGSPEASTGPAASALRHVRAPVPPITATESDGRTAANERVVWASHR